MRSNYHEAHMVVTRKQSPVLTVVRLVIDGGAAPERGGPA